MDCTIVNFLPYALEERKPIIPERYYIPAAKKSVGPGILHIKDARSNLYIRDGKTFPITHSAEEVATSLCNDYNGAQLEASHDACPALFWVFGRHSVTDILTKFKDEVAAAKKKQNIWYTRLVRRADDDWNKWKQHRMITDIQRHAATELGMVNKEWYQPLEPQEFIKCPACSVMVETTSAICHNCKYTIDETKAKALGITETKWSGKATITAKEA